MSVDVDGNGLSIARVAGSSVTAIVINIVILDWSIFTADQKNRVGLFLLFLLSMRFLSPIPNYVVKRKTKVMSKGKRGYVLYVLYGMWNLKGEKKQRSWRLFEKKRTILNFWFQLKERRQYYGVIFEIFLQLMSVSLYANCHKLLVKHLVLFSLTQGVSCTIFYCPFHGSIHTNSSFY